MYLNNFFVFGTLLPGLDNYKRFIEPFNPRVFPARAKGIMYYLPMDGYPVIINGEGEVKGVVFISEQMNIILPDIDEIQKYTGVESQSHLFREIRDAELVDTGEIIKAHMYMWPPCRTKWLRENAEVIPDGDWARFLANKNK